MYPIVTIDGAEYIDNTQSDRAVINPAWTILAFVPEGQETINVSIALYDEDFIGNDDLYDISEDENAEILNFVYNMVTQEIEYGSFAGLHNTAERAVVTVGDGKYHAAVSFYATSYTLGDCGFEIGKVNETLSCRVISPSFCSDEVAEDSGAWKFQAPWIFVFVVLYILFQ